MPGRKPKFGQKSWVEQWPEATRRLIFWLSLVVLSLIIFGFWLFSLRFNLPPVNEDRPDNAGDNFEQLQNNLRDLLNATTEKINTVNQDLASPAVGLSDEATGSPSLPQ